MPDKDGNPYPTRDQCYITCTKTANSNQEWTNLILKKVILPELGMDMTTETSPEKIGLIWDEFRDHSAAIVKEYCLSLSSFHPEIIPGGLTTVAQPLDKVINRIQGKYMLENKKLLDCEIMYQFLRRIPIQNRTIAYDIVNRDSNEKQVFKVPDNNMM